jgi:hypothetical protein
MFGGKSGTEIAWQGLSTLNGLSWHVCRTSVERLTAAICKQMPYGLYSWAVEWAFNFPVLKNNRANPIYLSSRFECLRNSFYQFFHVTTM